MNRTQNYGTLAAGTIAAIRAAIEQQHAVNVLRVIRDERPDAWTLPEQAALERLEAAIGDKLDDQPVRVAARLAIRYAKTAQRISGLWPARWTEARGGGA
jgi:hypothetical protein